jgi:hypothetical protein
MRALFTHRLAILAAAIVMALVPATAVASTVSTSHPHATTVGGLHTPTNVPWD